MQLRDRFPIDAVKGSDFVNGRYELAPGCRVVDLDTDLDAMPAWGRLCLHESTVRDMCQLLGIVIDPELVERVDELETEVEMLRADNAKLLGVMSAVEELATLVHQRLLKSEIGS